MEITLTAMYAQVPSCVNATYFNRGFFWVSDKIAWVSNISPLTHSWVS